MTYARDGGLAAFLDIEAEVLASDCASEFEGSKDAGELGIDSKVCVASVKSMTSLIVCLVEAVPSSEETVLS